MTKSKLKPFKFFITAVHELPVAGKVVVDGFFVEGVALTGDKARIESVVDAQDFVIVGYDTSGFVKFGTNKTTLTLSLKNAAAAGVCEGRTIVSAG